MANSTPLTNGIKRADDLNEAERALLDSFRERQSKAVTAPRAELTEADGKDCTLKLAHKTESDFDLAEAILCEALGTEDKKYAGSLINSIANASAAPDRLQQNGHEIIGNAIVAASTLKAESPAEGMLIAQMIAVHNSAMTMLSKMHSSTHLKQMDSMANQANKLLRTFATQMETLKRFRQKASQTVRVERVYVNEGGQAIVGNINTGGGAGMHKKARFKPMLLDMQQAPRCGAKTRKGTPCQSPAMKNGRCRMHGGLSTGAPKGNKNALKHGYYTAEAIAERRMIRALLKESRELVASI